MIGLARGTAKLFPFNPVWARLYEEERQLLTEAFGDTIIAIEHVGSTSIPGIPAKPIIDINIGVGSLSVALEMKDGFAEIGYEHRPFAPGRTFDDLKAQELYVKGPETRRTHHIHVAVYGSEFWRRTLIFRDYLRANPARAREYAALKTRLASEYSSDRTAYSRNKSSFIVETIAMANPAPG